jgi:hypothetical protein
MPKPPMTEGRLNNRLRNQQQRQQPKSLRPAYTAGPADRPCRRCNTPLTFVTNMDTGKALPLDTRAPVFVVVLVNGVRKAINVKDLLGRLGAEIKTNTGHVLDVQGFFVSHFATCPKAGTFSKGRQQQQPELPLGGR